MFKTLYSHGKLLITGEYLVLDGAQALAVPTKQGQSLIVQPSGESGIVWESLGMENKLWLSFNLSFEEISAYNFNRSPKDPKQRLVQILASALHLSDERNGLNSRFLKDYEGLKITTKLEFPQDWGLGSSSTLINNIADWAEVDAYELLQKTFGGSGYDIACAKNDTAILYQLQEGKPKVKAADFDPPFAEDLFFVYLNKKQNSRDAIKHYRRQSKNKLEEASQKISQLSAEILSVKNLKDFEELLDQHEEILSKILNLPTIKNRLFSDFRGSIKSLGGWGGDFVLATGDAEEMDYFRKKGFNTIVPFKEMVL